MSKVMFQNAETNDIKAMTSLKKSHNFSGTFPVPPKKLHSLKIMNTAVVFIFFFSAITVTYGQLGVCVGGFCPFGYVCNTGNYCYLATTCFDVATNCAANIGLCTNSLYISTMTSKCRRTCNLCGGTTTSSSSTCCSDLLNSSGINECSSLQRLCNNTAYYTLMTQQCPRTCGRCVCG